ncbi:hypothetical protein [Streptomyces sp. NPDC089795]|uniref:hypothetical protein n=1 Tax=Streptomyces sp. NPDC089795 TaxID=3155297 RepID=UPI0034371566
MGDASSRCRRDGCAEVRRVGGANDLGADVMGHLPDGRASATRNTAPSAAPTCRSSTAPLAANVLLFVASCKSTKQARSFAARHRLVLVDVDLLGFWNSGTALTALLDLDSGRSGTNRKLAPDN